MGWALRMRAVKRRVVFFSKPYLTISYIPINRDGQLQILWGDGKWVQYNLLKDHEAVVQKKNIDTHAVFAEVSEGYN